MDNQKALIAIEKAVRNTFGFMPGEDVDQKIHDARLVYYELRDLGLVLEYENNKDD